MRIMGLQLKIASAKVCGLCGGQLQFRFGCVSFAVMLKITKSDAWIRFIPFVHSSACWLSRPHSEYTITPSGGPAGRR